jgi:D-alanine-D-alanine ligase
VPWVTSRAAISPVIATCADRRIRALGLPAFVKPARAGSSVGVSKVSAWSELDAALETAFAEDGTVLVEQAVVGREVECGVLAGRDGARRG